MENFGRSFIRVVVLVLLGFSYIEAQDKKREENPPAPEQEKPKGQEEPQIKTKPIRLEETVITATRSEEDVINVPQSATVVTPGKIQRRQSRTPAELLREEPGIWVQQTGSSGGTPIIRGQLGNRVLYLWDGIRINNGAIFIGPNPFFNQIQEGAIERIEVVRGPGAVQYGSDAIGGVINVITKQVNEFPKQLKSGGQLYGRYGSVANEFTEFGNVWLATDRFNVLLGGTLQNFGDYTGGGGVGKLKNTSFDTKGYFGKIAYRISDNHTLRLSWQDNRREDAGQYVQSKINASRIPRLFTPLEDRSLLKLDYEGIKVSPWLSDLKGYLYLQNLNSKFFFTSEKATTISKTVTDTDQDMYGFGLQATSPFEIGGKHNLTYGLDYRKENLGSSKTLLTTTKATGAVAASTPQGNTPDGTYDVFDLFLIDKFQPTNRWTLTLGGRFETPHLNSNPKLSDTVAPFTVNDLNVDKHWNSFTWSLGSLYWFNDNIGLAGDIATGFRAPTFGDTLSFGVPFFATGIASIPSPNVNPEHFTSYELGPRLVFDHWDVTATAYWTAMNDLIQSKDTGTTVNVPGVGNVKAFQSANIGEGFVRGFDITASYHPTDEWTIWGTYSEAYGEDTKNIDPLRFIPPRSALLGIRWEQVPKKWWAEGLIRVVAQKSRHAPDDELDAAFSTDPGLGSPNTTTNPPLREGFEIPGYALLTLRGGVEVYKKGNYSLNITAAIENLTNKRYREIFSRQLADPGTNFILGVDIRF